MNSFVAAKARFDAFLEDRQKNAPKGRDMREYIESLRFQPIGIACINDALIYGFSRGLLDAFPRLVPCDLPEKWCNITVYFGTGCICQSAEASHKGLGKVLEYAPKNTDIILFEQGFLSSVQSWQQGMRHSSPVNSCLGYIFDDMAHYYMADYPNRLTEKLNCGEELSQEQLDRAKCCMDFITKNYISKYNHQPYVDLNEANQHKRHVLVVDQSFADASIAFGRTSERSFQEMLLAAIQENPGAEVWVKTHPDSIGDRRNRVGYFSGLKGYANVRMLTAPMNPIRLIEQMDKIYVATSGLGFEALLMGKKVVCFGAPFYAGWGLTDDRLQVPHRHRKRSLTDIFYYFYIWYTHYHTPESNGPCEIEDVLQYILKFRPIKAGPPDKSRKMSPKISVIVPTYNSEKYIKDCLETVLQQTLRDIEVIVAEDCSTDRTLEIVEDFAAKDARVQTLRMEQNIGQGFARNKALDIARGDYIWFIDSDDFMPNPDTLERLYNAAVRNKADIVRGRKMTERLEDLSGCFIGRRHDKTEKYFSVSREQTTFQEDKAILHSWHFWLWLYRREFLNNYNVRFVTTQMEERPFVLRALLASETLSLVNCDAVRYRVRKNSTMRRQKTLYDVENQINSFAAVVSLFQEFGARGDFEYHKKFTVSQYLHFFCFGFAVKLILQTHELEQQLLLTKLAQTFSKSGVKSWDLIADPETMNKDFFSKGVYHMLLVALKQSDTTMLSRILGGWHLSQEEYYHLLRKYDNAESTYALNLYISAFEKSPPACKAIGWPAKRPEILLHIGTTKTGSTFLQNWMEINRIALLEQGIWYPEFGIFRQAERKHKQAGHADLGGASARGESLLLDRIAEGLKLFQGTVHRIIFSSEAFFLSENAAKQLRSYLADFDVRILVYLRRQDEWANSQYCEFVGGGAIRKTSLSVEQWLAAPAQLQCMDYYSVLMRWEAEFGGNVEPVPFEKTQLLENDLLNDFCSRAGIALSQAFKLPDKKLYNDYTYPKHYYCLMRIFNQLPFISSQQYLAFVNAVQNLISFPFSAKPQMLSRAQRHALLAQHAAGNSLIATRYLNRKDGNLFLDENIASAPDDESDALDINTFERMWDIYRHIVGDSALDFAKKQEQKKEQKGKQNKQPPVSLSRIQKTLFWIITPVVKKLTHEANFYRFKENPATFFKSLKKRKYRIFGEIFFPTS